MIKIGHRGAMALEPENTLRAIGRAIDNGMDYVEIDVRRTKDHKIVVIHDEKVDRLSDGEGFVCDMNLSELKKLDFGKGERIQTVQEVISFIAGRCKLMIELKEPTTEVAVAEIIEKNKLQDGCIVISFYHTSLKMIKSYSLKLHTGALFVGEPVNIAEMVKSANADVAVANFNYVTPQVVSKLHNAGLKIFVWNCDTEADIKCMARMKVDAISSNDSELLAKVLEEK
jgi:glycerophosphoryl diester phosphodiesterase